MQTLLGPKPPEVDVIADLNFDLSLFHLESQAPVTEIGRNGGMLKLGASQVWASGDGIVAMID